MSSTSSRSSVNTGNYKSQGYTELIRRIERKLKVEKNEKKQINTTKDQIQKLISIIDYNMKKPKVDKKQLNKRQPSVKLDEYVLNRLKARNEIQRIKTEQLRKIEEFGGDLNLNQDKEHLEAERQRMRERDTVVYFNLKCKQVKTNQTNKELAKHESVYCDSIVLCGKLARSMPREGYI